MVHDGVYGLYTWLKQKISTNHMVKMKY